MAIPFTSIKGFLHVSIRTRITRVIKGVQRGLRGIPSYVYFKSFIRRATFSVLSDTETIDMIINKHVSIARFGDGEYGIMQGIGNGFQSPDPKLSSRLAEVLTSNIETCLICIPRPLVCQTELNSRAKSFWRDFIKNNGEFVLEITPRNKTFGNTQCTRLYIDLADKKHAKTIINQFRSIWKDRDICIVEGENSRLGCGNGLFNNAKSIKRIICPPTNAFKEYDRILTSVKINTNKEQLIVLALGMTATVLAFDLSQIGYQALDVGHIDIEYEWYLMHATKKVPITGKAVNECGQNYPQDTIIDNQYIESIIDRVL